MSDALVCAGCLASKVKMCNMSTTGLLQPYQLITGVQYNDFEMQEMPDKLCWECAAFVNKFRAFRLKCVTAHTLLRDIYMQHCQISPEYIDNHTRQQHGLCSPYSIFKLTPTTYTFKPFTDVDDEPLIRKTRSKRTGHASSKKSKEKEKQSKRKHSSKKQPILQHVAKEEEDDDAKLEVIGEFDCEKAPAPIVKVEVDVKLENKPEFLPLPIKEEFPNRPDADCDDNDDFFDADAFTPQIIQEHAPSESLVDPTPEPKPDRGRRRRHEQARTIRATRAARKREPKRKRQSGNDFGMIEEALTQEQQHQIIKDRQKADGYSTARFRCDLCFRVFNEQRAFNNHLVQHDPVSGDIVCDVCKLRYRTRIHVYRHIIGHHMKKYTCRTCNAVFYNRPYAQKHFAWHKGVTYTCHKCGATFEKRTSHLNHLRIKHASEHVCKYCGEAFVSSNGVNQHIKVMHAREMAVDAVPTGPYCGVCEVHFTTQQAWTRHILISPKHSHEKHLAVNGCDYCGESFPDPALLKEHKSEHRRMRTRSPGNIASDPVIHCEQCGKPQADNRAYHAHFRREHPDKTRTYYPSRRMRAPIMCDLCGKMFQSKLHLQHHSYTHTGERPYKCDLCGKRFKKPDMLKIHMRTHTKELPYTCDICGQGFSNASNLNRHGRVHSDAKPYPCETCGKFFKCKATVKTHFEFVHLKRPWPRRDGSGRRLLSNTPQLPMPMTQPLGSL